MSLPNHHSPVADKLGVCWSEIGRANWCLSVWMTDGCQDGCQYPRGHWFLRGKKSPLSLPTVTHRLRVLECFTGLWILKDHPLARGRSQILIRRFLNAVGRTPWAPDLENQNRDLELIRMKPQERCSSSRKSVGRTRPRTTESSLLWGVAPHVCTLFLLDVIFFFFWKKANCNFVDSEEN